MARTPGTTKGVFPALTAQDIARYLASKPLKKQRRDKKPPKPDSAPEMVTEHFLRQFSAPNLIAVLQKKGKPIDFAWLVREYLGIYDDDRTEANIRLQILATFERLLLLGAVQDQGLASEMTRRIGSSSMADPFDKVLKIAAG